MTSTDGVKKNKFLEYNVFNLQIVPDIKQIRDKEERKV